MASSNNPLNESPTELFNEHFNEHSNESSNESSNEHSDESSHESSYELFNMSSNKSFGGFSDGVSNGATKGSSSGDSTWRTTPPQANVGTFAPSPAPGRDVATEVSLREHLSQFVDHATTLDDDTKTLGEVIDRRMEHRMRKAEAIIPSMEPNLEFDERDRDAILNDTTTPEWANDDEDDKEAPQQWEQYTGKQLLEAAYLERSSQWFWGRSMRPREKKEKSRFFPKP